MNNLYTSIDLSKLPAPDIIENLDYETLLDALKNELQNKWPEFDAWVESEPVIKLLEVFAYRELQLRQRVNNGCRGVMLAYARGKDLDHLAANYGVTRDIIDSGDPNSNPPKEPLYEDDERLRHRTQLSLEGLTVAGSTGAYVFHALSASPFVKDVSIQNPQPGHVLVTILSTQGNGEADSDLIETVSTALNADRVRPLTDYVTVQGAEIVPYEIEARLLLESGPDMSIVLESARKNITDYVEQQHRLGKLVSLSGIYAALHITGVRQVLLQNPLSDIKKNIDQAGYCESIAITA